MTHVLSFRVSVAGWWLSVGVWLGAIIMLALAAAAVFRVVRDFDPTIGIAGYEAFAPSSSTALAAEGANRHADVIAGAVVGRSLTALAVLQRICAAAAVICLIVQTAFFACHLAGGAWGWPNVLRMVFVGLPVLILAADLYVVSPRVWTLREQMFDNAATTEQRTDARAQFQKVHRLNENMYKASTLLLAGAMIVSAIALHPAGRLSFDHAADGTKIVKNAGRHVIPQAAVQAAIDER